MPEGETAADPPESVGVLVTRPLDQAGRFVKELERRGLAAILFPVIRIEDPESWEACDNALNDIHQFDGLIFTSANAVTKFLGRGASVGTPPSDLSGIPTYAVGSGTAEVIKQHGISVSFIPSTYSSAELGKKFTAELVNGKRFLLPRGDIAREELQDILIAAGAIVDPVVVYRTRQVSGAEVGDLIRRLGSKHIRVVSFTSPSAVHAFFGNEKIGKSIFSDAVIASIGPTTSAAVVELGLKVGIEAATATTGGLADAIAHYYGIVNAKE